MENQPQPQGKSPKAITVQWRGQPLHVEIPDGWKRVTGKGKALPKDLNYSMLSGRFLRLWPENISQEASEFIVLIRKIE